MELNSKEVASVLVQLKWMSLFRARTWWQARAGAADAATGHCLYAGPVRGGACTSHTPSPMRGRLWAAGGFVAASLSSLTAAATRRRSRGA